MLLLMSASLIVGLKPPQPILPSNWITNDDYPEAARRSGVEGTTQISVTVSPKGKPEKCAAMVSSGDVTLDMTTCALILLRGKFQPAQDSAAVLVYGEFKARFNWVLNDSIPDKSPPELEIFVSRIPGSKSKQVRKFANILSDEQGSIVACDASQFGKKWPNLANLTCDEIKKQWRPRKMQGASGVPVKYVSTVDVSFVVDKLPK